MDDLSIRSGDGLFNSGNSRKDCAGANTIHDYLGDGVDVLKGQVLKTIDKSRSRSLTAVLRSETVQGRILYRRPDGQKLEVFYGEKDQLGSVTMQQGDLVEFQLPVNRRDEQQRATNIRLLEESFVASRERREYGVISNILCDTGLITCAERNQKIIFNFSELLEFNRHPQVTDEVEFTVILDPTSHICRRCAIRIRYLPPGTVEFEPCFLTDIPGEVIQEPSSAWRSQETSGRVFIPSSAAALRLPAHVAQKLMQQLSTCNELNKQRSLTCPPEQTGEPGLISFVGEDMDDTHDIIDFDWKGCKHLQNIRIGTTVLFDMCEDSRTRKIIAANIRSVNQEKSGDSGDDSSLSNSENSVQISLGELEQLSGQLGEAGIEAAGDLYCHLPPLAETQRVTTSTAASDSPNENSIMSSIMSGSFESGTGSSTSLDELDETPQTRGCHSPSSDSDGMFSGGSLDVNCGTGSSTSLDELDETPQTPGCHSPSSDSDGTFSGDSLDVNCGTMWPVTTIQTPSSDSDGMFSGSPDGNCWTMCPVTQEGNKNEAFQVNEIVEFVQVEAEVNVAVKIGPIRKQIRATVESVKGAYGFLSHELDDGKKLFFHKSEVKGNVPLNPGDEVEFGICLNPRNGKFSACSLVKLSKPVPSAILPWGLTTPASSLPRHPTLSSANARNKHRPERLLNLVHRVPVDDSAPRLIVMRQPYGPDGSTGFKQPRPPKIPGVL